MRLALLLLLVILSSLPLAAAEATCAPWTGIAVASVVVAGNGIVNYDAQRIRGRIEQELRRVGLPCIDIHQIATSAPRVLIMAHIDGIRLREGDGTTLGCVYHCSLSAMCLANQVVSGAGVVTLAEHHNLDFGPGNELPDECIDQVAQLASSMAMSWLHDNPR